MTQPPRQHLGFGRRPNEPLSRREHHRAMTTVPNHVPRHALRDDRPVVRDSLRQTAPLRLYGDEQNATIVGLRSVNRPPKDNIGVTVESLAPWKPALPTGGFRRMEAGRSNR